MALIFCPECGNQVSEHAQACPKCAYPINKINSKQTNNQIPSPNLQSNSPNVNSTHVEDRKKIIPKVESKNDSLNAVWITLFFIGLIVLYIVISVDETKNVNESFKPENSLTKTENTLKYSTTCHNCEKIFSGLGYKMITENTCVPCKEEESSECIYCSVACGKEKINETTEKYNKILNEYNIEEKVDDGKVYDQNVCSLCNGTGIEKNTAQHILGGESGRTCPMCDGKGRQGY